MPSSELFGDLKTHVANVMTEYGVPAYEAENLAHEVASRISWAWHSQQVYISKQDFIEQRKQQILRDYREGKRVSEIARNYRLSPQWVKKLIG